MKNHLILLCLLLVLISCGKKSSITDFIDNPDDSRILTPSVLPMKEQFQEVRTSISSTLYSQRNKSNSPKTKVGSSIRNLMTIMCMMQTGNILFTATPEVAGDTSSFINRSSSGTRHSKHRKESA